MLTFRSKVHQTVLSPTVFWLSFYNVKGCQIAVSFYVGLCVPEDQRHVRNQKDQQRQLLGSNGGRLLT